MKLHPSQRSHLAETLCRQWIRARHIRLKAPRVYVIFRQETWRRSATDVSGCCYSYKRLITLHLGKNSLPSEWLILLAHEFSHYLNYYTQSRTWRKLDSSHGERFQNILWNTLPVRLWQQASQGHWVRGASAHRIEFQNPDRLAEAGLPPIAPIPRNARKKRNADLEPQDGDENDIETLDDLDAVADELIEV